jgi:hypothetical protein
MYSAHLLDCASSNATSLMAINTAIGLFASVRSYEMMRLSGMSVHNADIAKIFNQLADLLEIEGSNPFRIRA